MVTVLWEILVPTVNNEGKPFRTRHHKEWDKRVLKISDGLTILHPTKGYWKSPKGTLFEDRMIPVHIACSEHAIHQIAKITMRHYDQEAVMFYCISQYVVVL